MAADRCAVILLRSDEVGPGLFRIRGDSARDVLQEPGPAPV
ncbi:hypothetical protein AB0F13_13135 [Streptomyces sp. NPDC026206]